MSLAQLEQYGEKAVVQMARDNLQVFTTYLGYDNAAFHTEWYDYLQHSFSPLKTSRPVTKFYLLLAPRGHAKTECMSINYVSWLIGKHPNIHVCIVTKTGDLAESILSAIKARIETDPFYNKVFPNVKPRDPQKWTQNAIVVNRTEISKNPTVKATGLLGPITGGRNDLIICDDIIDEENVITEHQMRKASVWFHKVLMPTLYAHGGMIVVGTRWHYADIYSELLEEWEHYRIYKAILDEETGKVLWPEFWPLEKLAARKDKIGSVFFSCQYMNDPTPMEGDLLQTDWLHYWTENEEPDRLHMLYTAGVDPALGEGDLTGIAIIGYDSQRKQAYLVDVIAERMSFPVFLAELNRLHQYYGFSRVCIESNAFQRVLINLPELRGLPCVPTNTDTNKERRIIAMGSHFQSKRVLVNPRLDRKSEFWREWVEFPRGQYDDALDSVEIACRTAPGIGASRGFFGHKKRRR